MVAVRVFCRVVVLRDNTSYHILCSKKPAGIAFPFATSSPPEEACLPDLSVSPPPSRENPSNANRIQMRFVCFLESLWFDHTTQRRMLKDYRTVMHACLRAGAWDEALSVWSDLRAQPGGPRPCIRTYATALRACGALGLWTTARDLLSEMRTAGGDLSPEPRHYAFAVSAAAVADDRASDEEMALSGRGWGDGRAESPGGDEDGAGGGDGGGDTALRFVLSEMSAGGAKLGWEAHAAVCWARSQRKHWHRASLGVLELIRECGLELEVSSPTADRQPQRAAEGMRSLYGRLLAAAGKIPGGGGSAAGGGGEAARAVRQIVADAEERLASLPGGPGPHVIAAAGVAFARAGDWESARDAALRLASAHGENIAADDRVDDTVGSSGRYGGVSAFRRSVEEAGAAAASAAVAACARAGELEEAETLAELDFGQKAGLALAAAYERAGRFSDAEALRLRLQGRLASSLGLDEAGGVVEGRGRREGGQGREWAAVAPARLPNVGGRSSPAVMPALGEEGRAGADDVVDGSGADDQYDLFLQWMETGEEDVEDVEEAHDGGVWPAEEGGGATAEIRGVTGSGAGTPIERGSEEGLTIRELEGW